MTTLPGAAGTPDTAEFFDGLARGVVVVQACTDCGARRGPRTHRCPSCGSVRSAQVDTDGRGTLASWTVVRRAPTDEFADAVPYALGIVDLGPGVRFLAHLTWLPDRDHFDTPVRVFGEEVASGWRLRAEPV